VLMVIAALGRMLRRTRQIQSQMSRHNGLLPSLKLPYPLWS